MAATAFKVPGLEAGQLVWDRKRRRAGVIMELGTSRHYLRPERGGREWEAETEELEPVTSAQALNRSRTAVSTWDGETEP